ncbi:MAG: CPBP family intramembrane metalloprotease [Acidobacteria bacterium]|nr:CPBP family intramembrane metalloprotease [Acidobacteriota bacterium]
MTLLQEILDMLLPSDRGSILDEAAISAFLQLAAMGGILSAVFIGALVFGWIRIKSGSILGPWLMHASGNVTMALPNICMSARSSIII